MKEIIDVLIPVLVSFSCIFFCDLCYAKLNNTKLIINKKNILIIVLTSILVLCNNLYTNDEIKTVFSFAVICYNFKLIYKKDIKNVIISYIMIFLILMLLEIITTNCLSATKIMNSGSVAHALNYIKLGLSICIGGLEYLIFCIKPINNLLQKSLKFIIMNSSVSNIAYLMFLTMAILGMLNVKTFASNNSIQFIICLVIIFIILFAFVFKSKTTEIALKDSNKRLIDYNDKYGKFLDEYKIYKHNIKNKLYAIKSYGNKKVNALIDDLLEEETNFSIKNNNLYNVPKGIKGIVAEKLYNSNLNVIVDNKIKNDPFSKLPPKVFNSISECIGIALDNAIEASEVTDNPIILMDLFEDEENIFIKIGNNFCNSIDIDELGSIYYSTKNRGSGLGLFSIMRNHLVKEKIDIINDFYYIKLQIKKAR